MLPPAWLGIHKPSAFGAAAAPRGGSAVEDLLSISRFNRPLWPTAVSGTQDNSLPIRKSHKFSHGPAPVRFVCLIDVTFVVEFVLYLDGVRLLAGLTRSV